MAELSRSERLFSEVSIHWDKTAECLKTKAAEKTGTSQTLKSICTLKMLPESNGHSTYLYVFVSFLSLRCPFRPLSPRLVSQCSGIHVKCSEQLGSKVSRAATALKVHRKRWLVRLCCLWPCVWPLCSS